MWLWLKAERLEMHIDMLKIDEDIKQSKRGSTELFWNKGTCFNHTMVYPKIRRDKPCSIPQRNYLTVAVLSWEC